MRDIQSTVVQPPAFKTTVTPAQVMTTIVRAGRGDKGADGNTGYCILHALSAEEVSSKRVALPSAPVGSVLLDVVGGTAQRQNIDFALDGAAVVWSGLSLELLLEVGDCLSISYF